MKELKRLIKKKEYNAILEYLIAIQEESAFCEIVSFMKKEELFVDRNGARCFDQYIANLRSACPLAKEYCDELGLINELFVEERKMQLSLKSVHKSRRLSNLLYCLNTNYLMALKNLKSLALRKDSIQDPGITLDGTALLYNATFKSILYDGEVWNGESFCSSSFKYLISFSDLKKCHKYMQLSAMTGAWDNVFRDWKQGLVKIFKNGDKITTKYLQTSKLTWFKLSKSKLQIYDYIKEAEISNIASKDPWYFSNELKAFEELIAWGTIKTYLHTDDLDALVDDVPIRYWIKTYVILTKYSSKVNFINSIYNFNFIRTFLSKIFFEKSQEAWMSLLVQQGIPEEYVDKIFRCLVYNKRSSDLYDFPFVKVKNKYMIIPALLQIAHPGELLKSRFRQNDFNISEKGKSFEKEIIDLLHKRNIPVIQIKRKNEGKEYECDLVFAFGETLFLCECKDNGDKHIFNYATDFYEKDLQQAKRIFDFYEKRVDEIRKEFANKNIKIGRIKRVEKMLIYNTVFHSIIEQDGIKVVDSERFISYFRRGDLDKRICQLYKGPLDCLNGMFTDAKFIKYLKSNYVVCGYDEIIRIDTEHFGFGAVDLDIEVERCNDINREELINITNPMFLEAKEFLLHRSSRF